MLGYINENGCLAIGPFNTFLEVLKTKDMDLFEKQANTSTQLLTNKLNQFNLNVNPTEENEVHEPKISETDFIDAKRKYYAEIFADMQPNDLKNISMNYIKSLQWILFYYYRSNCSWTFQYPYDLAPFISDLIWSKTCNFTFDVDSPAMPIEHLFRILPASSSNLLPKCMQQYANAV